MTNLRILAATSAIALGLATSSAVHAQSATTTGSGGGSATGATAGTGGSAAAGNTAASTVGAGATSGGATATGGGAAAAATNGRVSSRVHDNGKNNQAKAQAMDQGTFSKSHTHTKVKKGTVTSRTKSMAHVPGSKPVMSTTNATGTTTPPTP